MTAIFLLRIVFSMEKVKVQSLSRALRTASESGSSESSAVIVNLLLLLLLLVIMDA